MMVDDTLMAGDGQSCHDHQPSSGCICHSQRTLNGFNHSLVMSFPSRDCDTISDDDEENHADDAVPIHYGEYPVGNDM